MKKTDELTACIHLQHMFDCIESEQIWMQSEFKGLKNLHKKWFLSRWNSEVISVGIGIACALTFFGLDALTGLAHSGFIQLVGLTTMMPAGLLLYSQNLRRQQIIGADEQLSSPAAQCDIAVLDAFMRSFERQHADVSIGFMKKLNALKHNGLTPYQAYRIVGVLKSQFGITEYSVLNDTLATDMVVCASREHPSLDSTAAPKTFKL